jgi:hypothetical protein
MPEMQTPRDKTIILVIVAFAVFMATLDTSIVNISRPTRRWQYRTSGILHIFSITGTPRIAQCDETSPSDLLQRNRRR